jgi:Holliday junction resolvase RusA-like endonuclease
MIQKLIILGKLPNLNTYIAKERTNRYAAAAIKKKETERIFWECKIQHLKPVPKIDEATFTFYHANKKEDFDNCDFGQKFFWDGLVLAKIIVDDSQKYTPRKKIFIHDYDKKNPRIELEITTFTDPRIHRLS